MINKHQRDMLIIIALTIAAIYIPPSIYNVEDNEFYVDYLILEVRYQDNSSSLFLDLTHSVIINHIEFNGSEIFTVNIARERDGSDFEFISVYFSFTLIINTMSKVKYENVALQLLPWMFILEYKIIIDNLYLYNLIHEFLFNSLPILFGVAYFYTKYDNLKEEH